MGFLGNGFLVLIASLLASFTIQTFASCSNGHCRFMEECSSSRDCGSGLYCFSCHPPTDLNKPPKCIRSNLTDQFKLLNNSLPFNKYAFLATHNSFAINGEPLYHGVRRVTIANQDDSVTHQLHNGVRALMLDTYEYEEDVWLCHSFKRKCHAYTAFKRAIDTFKEIEHFLSTNPSEVVTLILEDYVQAPKGLSWVFNDSGLFKFWFPVSKMPKNGQDWPLVKDMVANNHRLVVFTSMESKQSGEGIAYQWNFMVENQLNHFRSVPLKSTTCKHNSGELMEKLSTCYGAAGNRWANFVAVDFYKRSNGGGAFKAVDTMNAQLLCNSSDLNACKSGSSGGGGKKASTINGGN